MKHYKQKKFFYRFFMRQSPRSGAMFGLAWMICFGAILPLTPWIFLQIYPPMQTFSDTDIVLWKIFCCLFCGISIIIIYAYGFLAFVKNFYTILRNDLKKSRFWKIPAIVGALNWELACIFLLPVSVLNKRRWLALVFLMCGLGLSLAGYILDNPLPKWWSLHVGLPFFLLLALSAMGKDKKFSWNFVYPFIVFVIFIASIILLDQCSQTHIESKRYELSAIGNKISEEDWKARNQTGYPVDQEPLKSFCSIGIDIDLDKYLEREEAKQYLIELRKNKADDLIIIDKLLAMKPQQIAYKWVSPAVKMILPDMSGFRNAAKLQILEIRADAKNKKLVQHCNGNLLKIREWFFCDETLISNAWASATDRLRLDALSYAIASGIYSRDEIRAMIGNIPDLSKQFSESFASEHATIEYIVKLLETESGENLTLGAFMGWENQFWQLWRKNVPLFLDLNLKRDYIFTLNYFLKIKELLYRNDLSGIEKKKLANIDIDRLKAKCFFTAAIGIADFAQILLRIEQVRDTYQMAQLAAEVMEYRKQQGKLPEDLSFLPEVPLSKVDLTPLMYEKTKDGFRIYSHTQDGKIPAAKDSIYSYHVRLREVQ